MIWLRFPQPTSTRDVVWATKADEDQTQIGKYDIAKFQFTPLITLPEIRLRGDEMWVDEAEGMVYLCVRGDLLRVPLAGK